MTDVLRILPLGDPAVSRREFGAKAHVLSRILATAQVRVPRGFALSVSAAAGGNGALHRALEQIASELRDDGRPMIVRSSASIEDLAHPLFPGRFASRRNLASAEDLLEGVKFCVAATDSHRVREYLTAHAIATSSIRMSLIVQEQVQADYAGVTFTRSPRPFQSHSALIELVDGEASGLLRGESVGALFGVNPGPTRDEYVHIAGQHYSLDNITSLLPEVFAACRRVERIFGESQDIEWVWANEQVYVVQARPSRLLLPDAPDDPQRHAPIVRRSTGPLLELSNELGQKAATQQYFGRLGVGAPNGIVIPPRGDRATLHRRLADRRVGNGGSVIRFSHREDAGLPVEFVPRDEDLSEAYLAARPHDDCAGIISDYVVAEHAFEAYLATDHLIVEHVPGNWEPQSTLVPDVLLWYAQEVQVWRATDVRQATYELPTGGWADAVLTRTESALGADNLVEWIDDLSGHFRVFRSDLRERLPLNIHFIRANGNWHFLNIRPTRDLFVHKSTRTPDARFKPRRCFFISDSSDLQGWDAESPLLISHHVDSEADGQLSALCGTLRAAHVATVLTTFGALSHPALVMREFGLEVRPLYRTHELVHRRAFGAHL